jgi:DNA-binding transcriptional LysR family regulator
VPLLLDRLDRDYPLLKVDAREVFGCDVTALLRTGDCDLALAPLTSYPEDIRQRTVRREVVRVAVGEQHRLADRGQIELAALRDETLELWPHEMAPGYYEAIIAACHSAGFEPNVDHHGAGLIVWGYIPKAAASASWLAPWSSSSRAGSSCSTSHRLGRCSPSTWSGDEIPTSPRLSASSRLRNSSRRSVTGPSDKHALSANNNLCLFTHVLATYRRR